MNISKFKHEQNNIPLTAETSPKPTKPSANFVTKAKEACLLLEIVLFSRFEDWNVTECPRK